VTTAVGIDIGGTSVKAAARATDGRVVEGRSEPYAQPDAATLRAAVTEAWRAVGAPVVERVGLCLPGRLDAERGVIDAAVNLPVLVGARPSDWLPEPLARARTVIVPDAEAAAFDIARSDEDGGRLLALSIGTGVGACVLDGRTPLRVVGRSPGRLGQVDVSGVGAGAATPIGPDGGRGSLEAYIGLPALRARFPETPLHELPGALRPGDPALRALAQAIRIAHAVYAPRRVVLLGGVGRRLSGEAMEDVRRLVGHGLTAVADGAWTLEQGTSDFHAARGVMGIARDSAPG